MASTLLARNALVLVTMDGARREIAGGGLYVEDGRIVAVGRPQDLPASADEVIDLSGHVVMPGMVNTHHHMVQSLTRAVPAAQDGELFTWLTSLYPLWAGLTGDMVEAATETAMAELILSGCTTSSDHLYIYPNGARLDDSIRAARRIGMRFHAARGAMTIGESKGGLPPDRVVEDEDFVMKDTERLIGAYHDPARYSMLRIVLAPCSPFTVSRDFMLETLKLGRDNGLTLHTHLAENDSDVAFSEKTFGMGPTEYVRSLGWVGPDVWHAHCVKLDDDGIALFAKTGTGIAHCPCSNMRLASGVAPVKRFIAEGIRVGLGVDGSASNDSGHMLSEARQAMLLQRVAHGPDAMSARTALELATLGGARVLGRDDIGALAPGMAADFIAFDMSRLAYAGALHDPVAALIFCQSQDVSLSVINGRVVVRDGRLLTIDLGAAVARHNAMAAELARLASA
ncbi:cytosine/adenosine deaminase-related metal-dependent hydrolase [Xanthobacter sp. SG618]|uniref:8-oxoguanine deaminase n=1 Tax=Xanthobacter sp. SG618 TaxID=2587121 RepID=UPI00145D6C2B|nr:8-oxoguanine deaminase [Xanthobacter sp. SG618]NMN59445.1 cytosine/adenosine deaminase-related metal-dependent hydrolase [Xanthobacter sp. SG618]